ncbi:hypothetical protein DEI99_003385 [Curtobacterium sp. MCLR17_036]|nr:hypothetical protein [Curtobacterium sp. MCLR17_036]WIE65591.1 hypothetical protein DEI99_003385 [Curtobacterium sp. MCLR17_036]
MTATILRTLVQRLHAGKEDDGQLTLPAMTTVSGGTANERLV